MGGLEAITCTGRADGKVVVVTGGAQGQGAAEAVALAREGATVVAADVRAPLQPIEVSPTGRSTCRRGGLDRAA